MPSLAYQCRPSVHEHGTVNLKEKGETPFWQHWHEHGQLIISVGRACTPPPTHARMQAAAAPLNGVLLWLQALVAKPSCTHIASPDSLHGIASAHRQRKPVKRHRGSVEAMDCPAV